MTFCASAGMNMQSCTLLLAPAERSDRGLSQIAIANPHGILDV